MVHGPRKIEQKRDNSYSNHLAETKNTQMMNMSSYARDASAGWILQVLSERGPTLYHTGDTNSYEGMGLINQLY